METLDTSSECGSLNARLVPPTWVIAWLAALLALAGGVRVADPTGWLASDDAAYYSAAEHLLTGQPIQRLHHQYARMGVIVPVAVSVGLFGETPEAVALPMLIASMLCIILVALLGRVVWGWWEGLLAATIVSVVPYFRILSTTAFPDVHVCLWATAAVLLAVIAVRRATGRNARILFIASGFALGLAVGTKLFAAPVVIGLAVIIWSRGGRPVEGYPHARHTGGQAASGTLHGWPLRRRAAAAALIACGVATYFLVEGLFFSWAADDFFFNLHAQQRAQAMASTLLPDGDAARLGFAAMAWDRLTLLLHPAQSGWGSLGVAFWIVVPVVFVFSRSGRHLACWAAAVYLVLALAPVSFKDGIQPNPLFHGRHILPACIPFALCLAWASRRTLALALQPVWINRCWPIAMAAVLVLAQTDRHHMNGFRDRPTGRVGRAISQLIATTDWDDGSEIFMTPSSYWRYRILFPNDLRSRLRVATDDDAPDWWRTVNVDIASRWQPLPTPAEAYLIATPLQLAGGTEHWDYEVGLPEDGLEAWRQARPVSVVSWFADKSIGMSGADRVEREQLVLLVGRPGLEAAQLAEKRP